MKKNGAYFPLSFFLSQHISKEMRCSWRNHRPVHVFISLPYNPRSPSKGHPSLRRAGPQPRNNHCNPFLHLDSSEGKGGAGKSQGFCQIFPSEEAQDTGNYRYHVRHQSTTASQKLARVSELQLVTIQVILGLVIICPHLPILPKSH